ncbi:5'-methylthioadenosine/adenosylhomocysteine nucleosidase [Helicobacter winghamensis]|uniref:adenosylhomocysteine nucleosidase n=1 Tax=Helicobacter winghamensis TaxID=157268 RepID=A0A2N3PIB5_9HELI|nr:5'-methylthioadenosine/adenosylhomocysteine nucleosidase [Helicobacter winghamensis]EEO25705.1 MTA/SAH nucleosidase [Helicobacter winghamensis ATCC BAA-430]PKT76048.1 5'-methylthioadenosine/S-adenosylhomocysteine nucleosidase [Helicobacter winghamensis]PKT76677.1 5'-methylthioadenosine/S-adenosylhomocysteine nucleosidase [Helicobacter winghamensis]PKT76796.1 5'-methylthioadenosine/S-adenosylhomocysteine nucleosidase [Helicobacter winghamensis]PKT80558.1 5'-methylthioadenosine/S-adenosylhomo
MIIGVIGAMREEITPLLEHYKDYETLAFGGNTFYKVALGSKTLIIACSRIGKVHSALTASTMILHFGCERIIFNGVAGGINPSYKIGDLVLASKLCQHDVDITIFGHPFGYFSEGKVFTESDSVLNGLAKAVAKENGINLYEGIVATGDQFIGSKERKEWIKKEFNADAIEMEGASVAVVCDNLNTPLCVIRAISDNAGDEALVSYEEFLESSARVSASLVIKMIEKL